MSCAKAVLPVLVGVSLVVADSLIGGAARAAEAPPPITELKNMCIDTALVRDGRPVAAVVAPADGCYDALAGMIVEAVKKKTGAAIPIVRDADIILPFSRNLVIVGNRSTNSVIEQLYNFYYTYLDLKYPGAGGYVVRSLHNPFATGHNAILIGGSDDRVSAAATNAPVEANVSRATNQAAFVIMALLR